MSKGKTWYKSRRKAYIPIATNNLIICCGKETEKNYFDGVVEFFKEKKENILLRFFIIVDAVDPLNMAKNVSAITAEVQQQNNCIMNNVWVLFDKDDFLPENFNNAISKIYSLSDNSTKFHALWSNQCFELWLLLNFINLQSSIDREDYIDKLNKYLKVKYKKNDKNIFKNVMNSGGNIEKAIAYSKALINESITPSNNDPATKVYEFFEYFNKYLNL